jgi:hypothetical protein
LAEGRIHKTSSGLFTVILEVRDLADKKSLLSSYSAIARKKMKDAIAEYNAAARQLDWKVKGYTKK